MSLVASRHRQFSNTILVCLALLALLILLAGGCEGKARSGFAAVTSSSRPFQEFVGDPVALATVKTVAILPFDDCSPEPGFKPLEFSTRMANQLAAAGKLRVIYPKEIMALTGKLNRDIRRHNSEYRYRNLTGRRLVDVRPDQLRRAKAGLRESVAGEEDTRKAFLDPARKVNDAVKLGRMLGADAVVMGRVTDYNAYMRPRISLLVRVVATGTTDDQARELAELCQWGIPRAKSIARGVTWQRQQNFDSRNGNIGFGAYMSALTHHVGDQVYDTESYLRSPSLYSNYVGAVLSKALLKARSRAIAEAKKRAMAEARRRKAARERVRGRLRNLLYSSPQLPDPDQVMAQNHRVQTERNWRPDIYNRAHPAKEKVLYAPENIDPAYADRVQQGNRRR